MQLQRLQSVARLLTIASAAAAAGAALATAVAVGDLALAAAVVATLLLRLRAPTDGWRAVGATGLVLAVAAVVGSSGGPAGVLLFALLFVVADYGLAHPTRRVVVVGVAAVAVAGIVALVQQGLTAADPSWASALALVPLVGVTAGLIGGRQSVDGTAALESATAALDEVLALAERIPAGFDRWSVATAVQLELREAVGHEGGVVAPHLLLVQHDVLFGVGSPVARRPVGLLADVPRQTRGRTWTKVTRDELPQALGPALGQGDWLLHRLEGHGQNGVVLVPDGLHATMLVNVEDVLRPAAVALANVDRFERLEDLADSAARRRVAHDLHDGAAQALTHVRFELDLLALEHDELTAEIARIRRVADAALLEVRRTVGELRESAPLVERLERQVELLQGFAPAAIELEAAPDLDVPTTLHEDVFRLVQEALSNAVRHAGASTIRVAVATHEGTLSVLVADDGDGLPDRPRQGVGLSGMATRAQRIGGELVVRPRRGGGTVVELTAPLPGGLPEETVMPAPETPVTMEGGR